MNWIFGNFGVLVFIFVVISVVRAAVKAAQLSGDHQAQQNETEEQRRVREIQERIRRKIAERRGEVAPQSTMAPAPAERTYMPPVLSRPSAAPLDPFGGPMKRLVTQLERRIQQAPPPPADDTAAVLARQARLSEELRSLAESRMLAERRAAAIAAKQISEAESEQGQRTTARGELLADLRETPSLRRAFVLREVLGPPVALR